MSNQKAWMESWVDIYLYPPGNKAGHELSWKMVTSELSCFWPAPKFIPTSPSGAAESWQMTFIRPIFKYRVLIRCLSSVVFYRTMFQHKPLSPGRNIRTLMLEPHQDLEAPINIALREICLPDNKKTPCGYEALSYVWGARTGDQPIQCEGQELLVTKSCLGEYFLSPLPTGIQCFQ